MVKWIQRLWHILVSNVKSEVVQYAEPAIEFIAANGGKIALAIAESVLSAAEAGTPWGTLIASFEKQAVDAGIQLAEGAAGAVLNYAQSNQLAKAAGVEPDVEKAKAAAVASE